MLLAVVVHAALDATRIKEIRDQQRGFKPGSHGIEMKRSTPEVEDSLGSPLTAEQVEQVSVYSLIANGIVAIKGRQSLARSGAGDVLVPFVAKEVSDIERAAVTQDVRDLSKELVIVLNLDNGSQVLRLQTEQFLDLIDAGSSRAEATGAIDAMQNEGGIQRRFGAPLAFVSQEVEELVSLDRAANIGAELIESQGIETRRR